MQDLKYDIRRGADTYSAVYHPRLKSLDIERALSTEMKPLYGEAGFPGGENRKISMN